MKWLCALFCYVKPDASFRVKRKVVDSLCGNQHMGGARDQWLANVAAMKSYPDRCQDEWPKDKIFTFSFSQGMHLTSRENVSDRFGGFNSKVLLWTIEARWCRRVFAVQLAGYWQLMTPNMHNIISHNLLPQHVSLLHPESKLNWGYWKPISSLIGKHIYIYS